MSIRYHVLEVMAAAAVFVNSGIVAFTASSAENYRWVERVWIFFLMSSGLIWWEYFLFYLFQYCSLRLAVASLVPDIPADVDIQMKRQVYIKNKVVNNIEDEKDLDDNINSINLIPDYVVRNNADRN